MNARGYMLATCLVLGAAAVASADYKDDIGWTALNARLGGATPNGAGVGVWQVEALVQPLDGNGDPIPPPPYYFMPDTAVGEFAGKTITNVNGLSSAVSWHATEVGRFFYGGSTSIAPGISSIGVLEADDWQGSGYLRTLTAQLPRSLANTGKVQNFSWIGTDSNDTFNIDALRRLDFVIDRDNVVAVVGVNNGSGAVIPKVLANSYNSIAVGLSSGNSSHGPTTLDVTGRSKPDIVAPSASSYGDYVSFAAPVVSAAAALLVETAGSNVDAAKSTTIKALLLAGATKASLPSWSHTQTQPLDTQYGAGQLNINNSDLILRAGEQEPSTSVSVGDIGWDFFNSQSEGSLPKRYFFDVPVANSASILVTWNRTFTTQAGNPVTFNASMANIDLKLYNATGFALGSLVDQSVSTIDNVEYIYASSLAAGRYAFEVSSDQAWDYSVAWAVPEPATLGLLAAGLLIPVARRAVRRKGGAGQGRC